ncbi:MAG TPA: type II CAAX endopeptidase family protein [Caulobacteraceae bacterium]|nr:type II CAAX endopeptidase family protein [Caulobacteraceae bacterium]
MSVVRKLSAFGLAALVSLAIVAVGQGLWQPLSVANLRFHPEIPWAAPAMAGVLALLLLYLSGRGWPRSTSERRRELLRWNSIPLRTFVLAVVAGVLALGAFGGLWIAVSDLAHLPPGIQPKPVGAPMATLITLLLTSSIAAPLTEEAAFRGYATGILRRAWGSRSAAVLGATALFAAVHFLQGLDPLKLALYFAAGLIFALVAEVTNSLYAAMVVHGLGDILGFTVLWPHDQQAHAMGFADPLFIPALVALAIFTPATVVAFRRLAGPSGGGGRQNKVAGSAAFGR